MYCTSASAVRHGKAVASAPISAIAPPNASNDTPPSTIPLTCTPSPAAATIASTPALGSAFCRIDEVAANGCRSAGVSALLMQVDAVSPEQPASASIVAA